MKRPGRSGAKLATQGFTLVEVMVAIVILSIGVLAVAGMASSSINQVRRGFNLTNSTLAHPWIRGSAADSGEPRPR